MPLAYYIVDFDPFLWQWQDTSWGIRYYSLAYLLGFLALYSGLRTFYRWQWSSLDQNATNDFLTYVILGTLIGGRLGYCFFYDISRTLSDPVSIVNFWDQGGISGMASHGGFIGIALAFWLFAKKHHFCFWKLADNAVTLAPIGIFLGRMANFINGELWGKPSTLPWAMIFPHAGDQPRHPSQLYEAFGEGILLFAILFWFRSRKLASGKVAILFLWIYAIVRIIVEHFREPDVGVTILLGLSRGQLLSIAMIFAGIILYSIRKKQNWKSIETP